jgi:hypothetical protein
VPLRAKRAPGAIVVTALRAAPPPSQVPGRAGATPAVDAPTLRSRDFPIAPAPRAPRAAQSNPRFAGSEPRHRSGSLLPLSYGSPPANAQPYRATLRRPGAKSRGTRHAACHHGLPLEAAVAAGRVTGATPSGRPGPQATNSQKRQAGAAPFKEDRWTAWRAPAPAIPRHAGQRASFAQARGVGGWRAGGAAGGTAAPRRAASQAGPA